MNCITINGDGGVSQIYPCNDTGHEMRALRTFISDDPERLERIQKLYSPSTMPTITPVAVSVMKRLLSDKNYAELRLLIKKYFGLDACCVSKMEELIAGL